MSLAIVYSRAQCGMEAPLVTVEVHLSNGLPSLSIVGLPETAVRESKDRVRGAILNSRFEFPARRITINLAPADLPKEGGRFDLPIALGILAASRQIPSNSLPYYEFAAELALSGELRGVHGILPMTLKTAAAQRTAVVSRENAPEATLASCASVLAGGHLLDITAVFVATTGNVAGLLYKPSQAGFVVYDFGIVLRVDGKGHCIDQMGQVGRAADLIKLTELFEMVGQGHQVDRFVAAEELGYSGKDFLMDGFVKIVG